MGEHSAPNGTVSVKMHKRKRLTLVVPREELDAAVVEQIERLTRENAILRRNLSVAKAKLRAAEPRETRQQCTLCGAYDDVTYDPDTEEGRHRPHLWYSVVAAEPREP